MLLNYIGNLGRWGVRRINAIGRATIMLFYSICGRPQIRKNFPQLIRQIYVVGVQSISIIVVSGLFIGMVLGLQGYHVLVNFMAEGALGQMIALAIIRELEPVPL